MRALFLALMLVCGVAVSAYARSSGNPVITINPDGSFTVVGDMPQPVTDIQDAPPVPDPAPAAVEIVSPVEQFAESPAAALVVPIPPPVPKAKPPSPVRQAKKNAPAPAALTAKPEPPASPHMDVPPESISREDARRIAIAVAPPSRSVNVYPADYNGLEVFQVVFKIENGEQYVLIDRQSGQIVAEKKGKHK